MTKVLFDTNVLYSAMIYDKGECAKFFETPFLGRFELVISQGILEELNDILKRPKAKNEINKKLSQNRVGEFLKSLQAQVQKDKEIEEQYSVPNDPQDDHVLSAAVHHGVDYLVGGDKHLLDLKNAPELKDLNLKIVSPKEFQNIIQNQRR